MRYIYWEGEWEGEDKRKQLKLDKKLIEGNRNLLCLFQQILVREQVVEVTGC